ncbi:sigma-70 family RNA polymerase sigma factor [Siminovitchia acidinfaciens]|uniref:Sigma-70 family RNA polymerase sigma factor n=1 Tax=Siminovitchia acidinfaciens TaxID=2321395 RepID=A0A429XXA0_9BACI|nr:sigma-70 family RNA polymerase sigma factor [Siminovitchia acidinfaciens]RST73105.1 sigma-70 family RNA polymerase sigma factor [Siminovitchia acidinfaciens]
MKDLNDEELMRMVNGKHRPALEEIYDRYIKMIYGFSYKFTNGNVEKTKEIVQLVFLKLWVTKSRYRPDKGSFVNWLLTITRNVCIDYIRKNHLYMDNRFESDSTSQIDIPDPFNGIEDSLVRSEISFAKSKLSTAQKRVIDLLYWKGYSLTEIAVIENEPVGTIKSRLHESLKRLRKYLELGDI